VLDLKGELPRAAPSQLARYLPRRCPDARALPARGLLRGDLEHVRFKVRGDLADFPYRSARRRVPHRGPRVERSTELRARPVAARRLDGPPLWPCSRSCSGDIVLDRGALEIRNADARMGELALRDVHGGFRSLYEQQALALQGHVDGPMTDFLRYVAQSPVGGWLGNGLAPMTATGNADLDIALSIPLARPEQTSVTGALVLAGNDVRAVPEAPMLADARARIDFTQHGVTVSGGAAHALGGDLVFDGGTQPDGALRFVAQGRRDRRRPAPRHRGARRRAARRAPERTGPLPVADRHREGPDRVSRSRAR
jgi:uncharacterized protein YhdP